MPRTRRVSPRLVLAGAMLVAGGYVVHATRDVPLSIRGIDAATGRRGPARVRLQDGGGNTPHVGGALAGSDNAPPIPRQAIAVMWGRDDHADGYALQPDGAFYVDGGFEAQIPPGAYTLAVSKGFEYLQQSLPLEARSRGLTRDVKLERWIDMPARG